MSPRLWTIEVTKLTETPAGETTIRRNASSPHALTETPHPSIRTIYDLVQFNARRWGDLPCFGTRKVIQVHTEAQSLVTMKQEVQAVPPETVRTFWELGPYEYRSYNEVAREGLNVGAGLRYLGLAKGDRVNIYADTSYVLGGCFLMTPGRSGNLWHKVFSISSWTDSKHLPLSQ